MRDGANSSPSLAARRCRGHSPRARDYGPDTSDPFRRAASYVDRILKGEKPADLPVQTPTKYEPVINLKTAKVLGIEVPPMLLQSFQDQINGSKRPQKENI